jgi:CTP synthase
VDCRAAAERYCEGQGEDMSTKFIFVTGGVVSGLGKGICAASLGRLLRQRGLSVRNQKFDPYINVDPGTMSPFQHGEVFVTDDGAETDLDLGHYERFVDETLGGNSSISSGKIYWSVLNRERRGDYLGATVQIIPHITNEIKSRIYSMEAPDVDVVISEIGGTVGDIESQPFLEAIRQVAAERGRENVAFIHVSLIVQIPGSGELKSKPTQHSVKELLSLGIQPDVLVCRCDVPITSDVRRKIALFCNVQEDCVIQNTTAETLYEVPLLMAREGLDEAVCRKLRLSTPKADLTEWTQMVQREKNAHRKVRIALVGKYTQLHDAYLSVVEALAHAGTANDAVVEIKWVDSETLNAQNAAEALADVTGVLVPGGFGDRGIEGMIAAVRYAREHDVPYFGICLGMQMAVVEFARDVLGYGDANSAEFSETSAHQVIALMPDQMHITDKGGTMRLGKYPCVLVEGSRSRELYGAPEVSERHRHRFEFNNEYREAMEKAGMKLAGLSPSGKLVEIVELPDHPWFVGVQFHPEFKSRPNRAQPLFYGFVRAALERADH